MGKTISVWFDDGCISVEKSTGINQDTAEFIVLQLDETKEDYFEDGDGLYTFGIGAYDNQDDGWGNSEGGEFELILQSYSSLIEGNPS